MPVNVNEPATWYSEPGAEGDHFDLLQLAVAQAMMVRPDRRHPRAFIFTKSGSLFGWDAIEEMHRRYR